MSRLPRILFHPLVVILYLTACAPRPTDAIPASAVATISATAPAATPAQPAILAPAPTVRLTDTPEPTLVPTLIPTPTLSPIGEIQPIPEGFVYLGDEEKLALGFNMSAGGAIGSLLFEGFELIDHTDYRRYFQLSFYDGNHTYGPLGEDAYGDWGWNPIQAGSQGIIGATVLEYRTAENSVYIKSVGKEWGLYDEDSDSDVIFETWAWLRNGYFEVYTRASHTGRDHHGFTQHEFPAAYFATALTYQYGYLGDAPFTGASMETLSNVAREEGISGWDTCPRVTPTENWLAFGTSDRLGLILAVPPQAYLEPEWALCLLFGVPRIGYISPGAVFDVPPGAVREATYYLIPGLVEAGRKLVYDLIPHTTWNFDLDSAEGWGSSTQPLSIANGVYAASLSPSETLTSRADLRIYGAIAPTVNMRARTRDTDAEVCLFFIATIDPSWNADKSECVIVAAGDFRTYEFDLQNNLIWNDSAITQLRLAASGPILLEIDFLSVEKNGHAWEFDYTGDSEGWLAVNDLETLKVSGGLLTTRSRGSDPSLHSPNGLSIDAATFPVIEIRMRVSTGGNAQIFFRTGSDREFEEAKSKYFSVIGDGQFHTYAVDMSDAGAWKGTITQIRLDPIEAPAIIEVDYIRLREK